MPVHADKAKANAGTSTVPAEAHATATRADNRPAARARQELQQTLDASPQVAQLHAARQMIAAAPVRRLEALQAAGLKAPPGIATDKPVQRVVRLNGIDYGLGAGGSLRRLLGQTALSADEADAIIAHVMDADTYVYQGFNRPALQRVIPAAAAPAPAAQDGAAAPPAAQDGAAAPAPLAQQPAAPVAAAAAPAPARGRHPSDVALDRLAYDHDLGKLTPHLRGSEETYRDAYNTRTQTVNDLDDPGFAAGKRLFHATPIETARLIRDSALSPKKPEWGGASASKDNYLSFALNANDANAMGGVAVVLRVTLTADEAAPGKWRQASDTEVITTQSFAPDRLWWKRKGQRAAYQQLATLPDPPAARGGAAPAAVAAAPVAAPAPNAAGIELPPADNQDQKDEREG